MGDFATAADVKAIEAESPWEARDVARTMHEFLSRAKAAHGDRPAVSYQLLSAPDAPARTLTWTGLHAAVTRAANLFRSLGVGEKDVVAFVLPNTMETNTSTILMEACASGAGIAAMPSYVSECEPRLKPLIDIKPLASVAFWLAYTERMRNTKASEAVLDWIRACFDPKRHACFREVYVPPEPDFCKEAGSGRLMF